MKKNFFILFICLSSFLSQAISDETLLKYGPRIGKVTGGVVGGVVGGVTGAATGYGIVTMNLQNSPENPERQAHQKFMQKTVAATMGTGMLATGAMAGAVAGKFLANKKLVTHFSKKYNINSRLAQAFVQTKISPANQEIREIFKAALNNDTDKIKVFLTTRYSKKFGPDWKNIIILDTIPTFIAISQINDEIKLKKEATFKGVFGFAGKEINALQKKIETLKAKNSNYNKYITKLLRDANFLGAISDLYLNRYQDIFDFNRYQDIFSKASNLARGRLLIVSLFEKN